MGKPRKGKKGKKDEDFSDDDKAVDLFALGAKADEDGEDDDVGVAVSRKNKKLNDRMVSNFAALSMEDNEEEELEEEVVVSEPKKAGNAFAFDMLDMMDEGGSDGGNQSDQQELKPAPKPQPSAPQPSKKGRKREKKGKNAGKNKQEEDIDAILAEIEGQGNLEVAAPTAEDNKGLDLGDLSEMTDEQLATLMGIDDTEGESKKERRKNKKKRGKANDTAAEEATPVVDGAEAEEDGEDGGVKLKTAAQKKKEKKERLKREKMQEKQEKKPEIPSKADAVSPTSEEVTISNESTTDVKETSPDNEKQPKVKTYDDMNTTTDGETKVETGEAKVEPEEAKVKSEDVKVESEEAAKATEGGVKDEDDGNVEDDEGDSKKKKGKKKKPNKMIKALQEALVAKKDEEARLLKEAEEAELRRIERNKELEEEAKREKERKKLEKKMEQEEIARQKRAGTYLTPEQKEALARSQRALEIMKAQGMTIAGQDAEKKKANYNYHKQKKKGKFFEKKQEEKKEQVQKKKEAEKREAEKKAAEKKAAEEIAAKEEETPKDSWMEESDDEIKESWDQDSDEEKTEEKPKPKADVKIAETKTAEPPKKQLKTEEITHSKSMEVESESESESESDDSSEESSSDDSDSDDDGGTKSILMRERATIRIKERKERNEAKKSVDVLRSPVVCVLGHVDTGKTKILDKLRRTNVQDGEAGGITQQIGATNVPLKCIEEQTKMCKDFAQKELKLPGLLIIDTPGHESFRNLRNRGSSLCDIAILVIDIMHGLEPQTIESLNLLKQRKTPFVVALNKIDRIYDWQTSPQTDIQSTIKKQKQNTKLEFQERATSVIVQLAEQGMNAALSYENKNPREYISLVPTSAHSGDGMGSLIALICELTQTLLAKKLAYSDELQATVMEVKALPGLGTTIDVILVNGYLREGQTIVLAGTDGPIVTQIRALLMPQPLRELRVKSAYTQFKEIRASQGVKIIAKELDHALAGLTMHVADHKDEIGILSEEVAESLTSVLSSIKLTERGVFVQASTLGSLEALLDFLKESKIPFAGINIGPVHKRDIMKASVMVEKDIQWAIVLAFDVKVDRDAQELADKVGVKIFTADIIYHLFDKTVEHREKYLKGKQDEYKHIAVFPCKLRVLPEFIFNSRDPIVCGVIVEAGFIKMGTPLCVPSKEFVEIGIVSSIEVNHKQVDVGKKGQEVCIKIESTGGDAPKMLGRHFEATDMIMSKISRPSIDAVKNYFRDEMNKSDWQLIVEMKKIFNIL